MLSATAGPALRFVDAFTAYHHACAAAPYYAKPYGRKQQNAAKRRAKAAYAALYAACGSHAAARRAYRRMLACAAGMP